MAKKKAIPSVAEVLKDFMEIKGMNAFSLSKELHVSYSTIRNIAQGKGRMTVPLAMRFAKYADNSPLLWIELQLAADLDKAAKNKKLMASVAKINKAPKTVPVKKPAAKGRKPASAAGRKKAAKRPVRKPVSKKKK